MTSNFMHRALPIALGIILCSSPTKSEHVADAGNCGMQSQFRPITPQSGIRNGLVLACGRLIRPPYKLTVSDKKLFVNEVQVKPPPRRQEITRSEILVSSTTESLHRLSTEVRRMWGDNTSKDEILAYIKEQPFVTDVKWDDEFSLLLTIRDESGSSVSGIELPADRSQIKRQTDWAARARINQERERRDIEASLKKGMLIVFRSENGYSQVAMSRDFAERVRELMGSGLGDREKLARLQTDVFNGDEIAAADLLRNYSPNEWALDQR